MGQSFESILIERSSKDTFKKAKALLHSGEIVFCHEPGKGCLRSLFRNSKGVVTRVEVHGFPEGPYNSACSCNPGKNVFCCHAVAACLHHAKYTIKYHGGKQEDIPALYAGLKFTELSDLLKKVLTPTDSTLTIKAESEFPHTPSKWERIIFQVSLTVRGRSYAGNLSNLRQLLFGKTISAAVTLDSFSQQDRQIIRYLAVNGQQEESNLSLDAEQTAEFFHCLIGFPRFFSLDEKVVIHRRKAEPALILEDAGDKDSFALRSAVIVEGALLPLKDVKVIAGRSGCWVGMLGEYWWIAATADVLWIRNFLRTTVQPCNKQTAALLLSATDLPFKVIENRKIKLTRKKFRPFYDGKLRCDGALEMELFFDYSGVVCPGDHERYTSGGGVYFLRDTEGENAVEQQLLGAGFERMRNSMASKRTRLILRDREAVEMFASEVIPKWTEAGKQFLLSSDLASLSGESVSLKINCTVLRETDEYFDLAVNLRSASGKVSWETLAAAAARNERTLACGTDLFIRIPPVMSRLAAGMGDIVRSVPSPEGRTDEDEILRIIRPAVYHWVKLAEGIPGAIPNAFLKMKVEMECSLEDLETTPFMPPPGSFSGELRNYQIKGIRWMEAMEHRGCNVVLADEMGLGKTVQTLAMLSLSASKNLPALVICPTSLIENWAREAARFTPELRVLLISGSDRKNLWKQVPNYDLCITSYSLIRRDESLFRNLHFKFVILDEAQHIKNPATANARVCKKIQTDHKLVLTGTPLENSPEDLWSIFDFLHPGLLGTLSLFRSRYMNDSSPVLRTELASRMAPFILRRRKNDVSMELPPKQEQILCCEMDPVQRNFYNDFIKESRSLLERFRKKEKGISHFEILSSLLRLRQICCDPALLPEELRSGKDIPSAKMELLKEMMLEAADSGHKVLLFSQFTSLLEIVRQWMDENCIRYEYMDGTTTDRMTHVDHFNKDPEIPFFLLSLKAGGVGLNLTSADTVIIYDPWWNPAAEAQAEDRTHRIGQKRKVTCLRLVVKDSIEEKVLELQQKKTVLFHDLVESPSEAVRNMSNEDLEFLLN